MPRLLKSCHQTPRAPSSRETGSGDSATAVVCPSGGSRSRQLGLRTFNYRTEPKIRDEDRAEGVARALGCHVTGEACGPVVWTRLLGHMEATPQLPGCSRAQVGTAPGGSATGPRLVTTTSLVGFAGALVGGQTRKAISCQKQEPRAESVTACGLPCGVCRWRVHMPCGTRRHGVAYEGRFC